MNTECSDIEASLRASWTAAGVPEERQNEILGEVAAKAAPGAQVGPFTIPSDEEPRYIGTATYSPEDNKIRISPFHRLDAADYARVRAAGFAWAPKQEIFVAPAWTPDRADLAEELCGEIGDEDTSLAERAEQRAERFEDYSDKRTRDAERAHAGVKAISDHIPLGQPILIGHHSERRARKDAERIENGMRKAVKMWETSEYWTSRAAGAIAHARYKERPDVRQRRIKTLEADLRKVERNLKQNRDTHALWTSVRSHEQAYRVAAAVWTTCATTGDGIRWTAYDVLRPAEERSPNSPCPVMSWEEVRAIALRGLDGYPVHAQRWIDHLTNRIAYERAMLAEAGGTAADKWKFEVGGKILRRGTWLPIVRVNAQSVSVRGHFAYTVTFDEITDYRPPTPEDAAAVAAAMKLPPLCNYPGEGFKHMTHAELMAEKCRQWSDFPKIGVIAATETHARHRVQQTRAGQWGHVAVYVTDKPRKDPPAKNPSAPTLPKAERAAPQPRHAAPASDVADKISALKATLAAGVHVAVAPQLFPTPTDLAARMVELAGIEENDRVLEPSAGTGQLLRALPVHGSAVAIEINRALCDQLRAANLAYVIQADFLAIDSPNAYAGELTPIGTFDRILMNPPFANGADIKHIEHARRFLREGGRLVAICANGPRQREQLMPLADLWEDLPAGTFAEQGTQVSTALLVIEG